jgi:hypothetical protein
MVVWYIDANLDGYFGRKNCDVSWLEQYHYPRRDYGNAAFLRAIGAIVTGSCTYEQILGFG